MKRLILAVPVLIFLGCQQPLPPGQVRAPVVAKQASCPPMLTKFVQKTNPALTPQEAERIAGIIERVADEYDIDPILFAAVIRQESHFKTGIKACRSVNGRRSCDYGIAQVNTFWVDEWELDASKLKNDVEYNVTVAARILKGVLARGSGDKFAYSLYNSANPEHRAAYQERIEKYRRIAAALSA